MTDPLDDLFHAASLLAYLRVANAQQTWPDSEAVRQEAYRLYEEALAERNNSRGLDRPAPSPV